MNNYQSRRGVVIFTDIPFAFSVDIFFWATICSDATFLDLDILALACHDIEWPPFTYKSMFFPVPRHRRDKPSVVAFFGGYAYGKGCRATS